MLVWTIPGIGNCSAVRISPRRVLAVSLWQCVASRPRIISFLPVPLQGKLTTQKIPGAKIRKRKPMKRSLMLNADQLGLSATDVADIIAWMKSY